MMPTGDVPPSDAKEEARDRERPDVAERGRPGVPLRDRAVAVAPHIFELRRLISCLFGVDEPGKMTARGVRVTSEGA